ncbi:hypothetical protein NSQ26_11995 [Bacillus sp. FSL W7-1360]
MMMKTACWGIVASLLLVSGCTEQQQQDESFLEPIEWNKTEQRLLWLTTDDAIAFKTKTLKDTVQYIYFYVDVYEDGELNEAVSQQVGAVGFEHSDTDELFIAYKLAQTQDDDTGFTLFVQPTGKDRSGSIKLNGEVPFSSEIFQSYASAGGIDITAESTPLFLWTADDRLLSNWYTEEGLMEMRSRGKTFAIIRADWDEEVRE